MLALSLSSHRSGTQVLGPGSFRESPNPGGLIRGRSAASAVSAARTTVSVDVPLAVRLGRHSSGNSPETHPARVEVNHPA